MDNNKVITPRHFLDLDDFSYASLRSILDLAIEIKAKLNNDERPTLLENKILAMIFEQTSTRTRVSFDVGMRQLGGETIMLAGSDMQLAKDETLSDTAQVMSRYVDAIMIRILSHDDLLELVRSSSIPVINGLTRRSHPCQVMADIMTYEEHRGSIKAKKVTWLGDANNVLLSWIHAAKIFDVELTISVPDEYSPDQGMLADISQAGNNVKLNSNPSEAVKNADLVITDTWVSMGDKDVEQRLKILAPYQVDKKIMAKANENALFMHCLPAHRGHEVTGDVIDGAQSVVFDEAENRLHIQKAILCYVFGIEKLN